MEIELTSFLSDLEKDGIDTSIIPTHDEENDKEMTAFEAVILGELENERQPFTEDLHIADNIKDIFKNNKEIQTETIFNLPLRILDKKVTHHLGSEMTSFIVTLTVGTKVFLLFGYENSETNEYVLDHIKEYGKR